MIQKDLGIRGSEHRKMLACLDLPQLPCNQILQVVSCQQPQTLTPPCDTSSNYICVIDILPTRSTTAPVLEELLAIRKGSKLPLPGKN
jgi:hypothetical protein